MKTEDGHTQDVDIERHGIWGCITLNRAQALNALTLPMIRRLTAALQDWAQDPAVHGVLLRGRGKATDFGSLCAGGDIRFFHRALLSGDPSVEDFFTEEYALNHCIQTFPKPYVAFMEGVVMGGGMGISQGLPDTETRRGKWRIVTANSKLAMPETLIGLFPDVGGGYFLSRCPGNLGEWLALTGTPLGAGDALAVGWADACVAADRMPEIWGRLLALPDARPQTLGATIAAFSIAVEPDLTRAISQIDAIFSKNGVGDIVAALDADGSDWAQATARSLRQRSPLMLAVTLEQVRRARHLGLADVLRLERGMMRHAFFPQHLQRNGAQSEACEGIRARVVDKDQTPRWNPARIEDVTEPMVQPFFQSPWPAHAHPLRHL